MKQSNIFKGKNLETSSHKEQRSPTALYINLGLICNEDCAFCVVKGNNEEIFGPINTKETKRIIKEFINDGGIELLFTGGEPTLRKDLPEIINYCQQFKTLKGISIITNGTRLSDNEYLKKLIIADKNNLMSFSISLHSHLKGVSEKLTNSTNTFNKTITGIKNTLKENKQISIYHIITSKNYKDLLGFVKFLNLSFPQITNITFAYPFPQGSALINDWIYVKISSLKPYFIKTLKFLENKKYRVSIASCGQFPLCALPGFEEKILDSLFWSEENVLGVIGDRSFHEFDMMSKEWTDKYKNKNEKCIHCLLNNYCQGFWNKYIDLFGFDGIRPINQRNFKGNKILSSLKNNKQLQKIIDSLQTDKLNLINLGDFDIDNLKKLIDHIRNKKIFAVVVYNGVPIYPR